MKAQFLASAALATLAASSALAAPAPLVMAAFTWTGCYVGVHAGLDWGASHWSANGNSANIDTNGAIGGAQAGCNYQVQNFVLGAEGEIWGSGLTGSTTFDTEGTETTLKASSDIAGDLAARFGYAFDRALIFGKIGMAWAHYKFSDSISFDGEGGPKIETATGAATYTGLLLGLRPRICARRPLELQGRIRLHQLRRQERVVPLRRPHRRHRDPQHREHHQGRRQLPLLSRAAEFQRRSAFAGRRFFLSRARRRSLGPRAVCH